ncbi:deoxyribodipyrimidine photo-lyase [Polaribacter sp. HL-MS24]|uniref:deoxyribodipyrimidine photo-lyase n=1 Tax=Polaribacter sp. HL-MS24 TaxID=3077735 RepID=UPI0029343384|nr:deoxyribodipyrimidine photo-lyase [Polaribacter sp. HL-MS24]WOC40580.1 deoxyribodipyrimidine photo-lyase [Polaribacter sp. HL-MS24]
MSINKEPIHVVWLKRDLRLDDNEAITNALASNNRTLLLYAFEETLIHDPHYSERHWDFIKQSIEDINLQLQKYNTKVFAVNSEVIPCLNQLQNYFSIDHIYSHQETGLLITFNRDRDVNRYCKNNSIEWTENINNGVLRGLLNREDWFENWNRYMHDEQFNFKPRKNQFLTIEEIDHISTDFNTTDLKTSTSPWSSKKGVQQLLGSMQILSLKKGIKNTSLIFQNQKNQEQVRVDSLPILLGETYRSDRFFKKQHS